VKERISVELRRNLLSLSYILTFHTFPSSYVALQLIQLKQPCWMTNKTGAFNASCPFRRLRPRQELLIFPNSLLPRWNPHPNYYYCHSLLSCLRRQRHNQCFSESARIMFCRGEAKVQCGRFVVSEATSSC
jgi:hypothetical protein